MYHYSVDGINFESLPPEKQRQMMGRWLGLLGGIGDGCELSVMLSRRQIPLVVRGERVARTAQQVTLSATESIGGILDSLGYDSALLEEAPEILFTGESMRHLEKGGSICRIYSLYDMPSRLAWGWMRSMFAPCLQIRLWMRPIGRDLAVRMMSKKEAILGGMDDTRSSARECEDAASTRAELLEGGTRLLEASLVCVVEGSGPRGLGERCREFERAARATGASFDAPPCRQGAAYYGEWRRALTCDRSLFTAMYPFHSAEMMETPNGVLLGTNAATGGPIIYDIGRRDNGNVAIIGASGSGKSFTAKLFAKRLMERVAGGGMPSGDSPAVYVIDPMNEYYRHRGYYGLDGIMITGGEELGLDPLKMLKPADAASILSMITRADRVTENEIMRQADKAGGIGDLYGAVSDHAKGYLQHLVDGPMSSVMRGGLRLGDQVVVSLKGMTRKPHEILILLLVLNKIWKRVVEMPPARPKVIILDEAWLLAALPDAMSYIEQIVRMGRKLNVKFVFISQNVDDISQARGAEGRLIDNMSTKILMRLEEDTARTAMRVMGLSEYETRSVTGFGPGEGLVLTERHRVMARFEATPEETGLYFSTEADAA